MSTGNRKVVVLGSAADALADRMRGADVDASAAAAPGASVFISADAASDAAAGELACLSNGAVLVVAGADVDRRTHAARVVAGLPRVIGTGTLAAGRHFARTIARRLRIDPRDVHAHLVGGASADLLVPLWSTASIAGVPLHKWAVPGHGRLTVFDRTDIFQSVKASVAGDDDDADVVAALVDLVRAIVDDQQRVLTVSTLVGSRHGVEGVTLSLPCIVSATGAEPPLEVPLNDAELAGLQRVAEVLRADSPAQPPPGGSA